MSDHSVTIVTCTRKLNNLTNNSCDLMASVYQLCNPCNSCKSTGYLQQATEDMDIPMSNVGDGTVGTLLPVTDYEPMANKIMPDLGYEIEDFKYNTWRVTNWRHLEKRITGPEFEAGNWKWRILLFPSGNNNQDTVSIYLDFVDPKGAPAGWHSCVQFALVLWNPEDPTQYIYHRMYEN
uniref:MATH domain-containing protein n=1 Tax=Rhizophagus irregularis (strain DAOM 181602 / DAOM 197198 / MUCL 43194) TaxID=747089 RepID=U9UKW1_RHIID